MRSSPDADIIHEQALKAAEGVHEPQNWGGALDHLQHAAQLGSKLAQAELAGLSGNWNLAHEILAGNSVTQSLLLDLRNSIDVAKWLAASYASQNVSDAPPMVVIRDLAAPEICDWLVARARPRLERAKVYAGDAGGVLEVSERTNRQCVFNLPDRDIFMAILRNRLAEVTQRPIGEMEPPQILHYSRGEEFKAHYDSPADANAPGFRQRYITALLSLNNDYEGGETEFPILGGRWRGRKGTAIYFWNVTPDGARDARSLHAGRPITQGEKWLMTQFITRPQQ